MLKSRRQPGTAKIAWIQCLWLIRTIDEFDGGKVISLCSPGHQGNGVDRATADQIHVIACYRRAHDAGSILQKSGRCIELYGCESDQSYVAEIRGSGIAVN